MVNGLLFVIQLAVTLVVGIYFYRQLKQQRTAQPAVKRESSREMDRLTRMRSIHLSEPLAEKVRPADFTQIVGHQVAQGDPVRGESAACAHLRTARRGQDLRGAPGAGGGEGIRRHALCQGCALY